MVQLIVRVLIGISGALALLVAARIWQDPVTPTAQLGVQALGGLGTATLRADLGGFFGAAGLFALAAAFRNQARLALVPFVMIGLALSGRLLTLATLGLSNDMIMPIAVEATLVVLYAVGWRVLSRRAV